MSTPDELLAALHEYCTHEERYLAKTLVDQLHAECSKGNLPSEYLRALAKRARDEGKEWFVDKFYFNMADTLEAWADE